MTNTLYQDMRFLIVDNVKPSQDILKQFVMRLTNKQVDSTHYAQDVVSICQEKHFDVILLGYDLGEKQKNGQQILEELRINNYIDRHCIVILITAEVSQAMVLAALEHKPDDYLCKPYTLSELEKRLAKCLQKKKTMSPIYQAIEEGDHALVIQRCDEAIKRATPYKAECLGIKSRQYFELQEYESAKQIYLTYKNNQNCQWARIGLGKIALQENKLVNAEAIFKSLIKKFPYYLSSYDWLAKTYQEQFNFIFAEETLEKALILSPRSILRLKRYAKLCLDNHHFDKATFAYEKAYNLAHNSIHHLPENAIMFAKSLVEYSPSLALPDAKKMNSKAFKYLGQMNKDFREVELKIHSHMLSACLYRITREQNLSNEEFVLGEKLLIQEQENIDIDKLYGMEHTISKLNKPSAASQILVNVQSNNIMTNESYDEKQSSKSKAQLALEAGQKLYQNKQYIEAVDQLSAASNLYPHHNGIKLNLLQSLLVSHETNKLEKNQLDKAKLLMRELASQPLKPEPLARLKKMQKKYQLIAGI